LTDAEVDEVTISFGGQYGARNKALFILGVKSGFRISELLSLRVGDVLQHGKIVDRVTVQRRNMKKKVEGRTVLLHPGAKDALASWLRDLAVDGYMTEDAFIFQSRRGSNRPISRIHAHRVLTGVFADCELTGKLGTHAMRKTFAARVYAKLDHDLVKTQKALGHRNVNSTVSYLSFQEEEIDEAILAI